MSLNNHECKYFNCYIGYGVSQSITYGGFNLICEITDWLHEWVVHFEGVFLISSLIL